MKNWIKSFIADERGSEGVELGVTVVMVAGGAIEGFGTLKGKLQNKQDAIAQDLDNVSAD